MVCTFFAEFKDKTQSNYHSDSSRQADHSWIARAMVCALFLAFVAGCQKVQKNLEIQPDLHHSVFFL